MVGLVCNGKQTTAEPGLQVNHFGFLTETHVVNWEILPGLLKKKKKIKEPQTFIS